MISINNCILHLKKNMKNMKNMNFIWLHNKKYTIVVIVQR